MREEISARELAKVLKTNIPVCQFCGKPLENVKVRYAADAIFEENWEWNESFHLNTRDYIEVSELLSRERYFCSKCGEEIQNPIWRLKMKKIYFSTTSTQGATFWLGRSEHAGYRNTKWIKSKWIKSKHWRGKALKRILFDGKTMHMESKLPYIYINEKEEEFLENSHLVPKRQWGFWKSVAKGEMSMDEILEEIKIRGIASSVKQK